MKKILSVSIAAYNIEKYIKKTLDSLILDEIIDKIEVIIVNDGSKDATSRLGHEYEKRYPDSFIVIDKENDGYGSTINASSRVASGKYFKTIDGDDWVDQKGFVELIKYLEKCNDDIVITHFYRVNDKNGRRTDTVFQCAGFEKTYLFDNAYQDQLLFMQAITIKTSILKTCQLSITTRCFYTDIEYVLTPIPYVRTMSFLDEFVYAYRVAVDEQSMSVAGKKKHIDEQQKIFIKMAEYYKNNKEELGQGSRRFFIVILSEMYKSHITAILSLKVCKRSKQRLRDIEFMVRDSYKDIYQETYKYKTVLLLRETQYSIYAIGSVAYKIYQFILPFLGR